MNKLLILLSILPVYCYSQTGTVLKGKITLNNPFGDPLPGIEITGFGCTGPDLTDNFGRFQLLFPNKKPGQTVDLIVKSEGYIVINAWEIESTVLRKDPDDPITIIMCFDNDEEYRKQVSKLVRIPYEITNDHVQRLKKEIEWYEANKDIVKQKEDSIKILKAEYLNRINSIDQASHNIAQAYLYKPDSIVKSAIRAVDNKNFSEAHKILNARSIELTISEIKAEQLKLLQYHQELELKIRKSIDGLILKSQLFILENHWDSVYYYYEMAVNVDTTLIKYSLKYADFLYYNTDYKTAEFYYKRAFNNSRSSYDKYQALSKLLLLYSRIGEINNAQQCYDSLQVILNSNKSQNNFDDKATINLYLGYAYHYNDVLRAEELYLKAIDLYKKTSNNNNYSTGVICSIALALENLGSLKIGQNDTVSGLEYLNQSRNQFDLVPNSKLSVNQKNHKATVYTGLASIHYNNEDYNKALDYYLIARELVSSNENNTIRLYQFYNPYITLRVSKTYLKLGEIEIADSLLNTTIELYIDAGRRDSVFHSDILEAYDELIIINPDKYVSDYLDLLFGRFNLFLSKNDSNSLKKYYSKTIRVKSIIDTSDYNGRIEHLAKINYNLAFFYIKLGLSDSATNHIISSINYYQDLYYYDSTTALIELIRANSLAGDIFKSENIFNQAGDYYKKALIIRRHLTQSNQILVDRDLCVCLLKLCALYRDKYELTKDEEYIVNGKKYLYELEEIIIKYIHRNDIEDKFKDFWVINNEAKKFRFYFAYGKDLPRK